MESMKDFEKEINESLKNIEKYNDVDASKWEQFELDKQKQTVFRVKITDVVSAGAITSLNDIRAFIPISHISDAYVEDIKAFLGKSLDVVIITADKENNKLVLSHKVLEKNKKKEDELNILSNLHIGDEINAVVESFKDYGAFVKLENGLSALLHISQISNNRIKHPGIVLKIGDKIKVKVIKIEDEKISVSKKILEMEENESLDEEVFDYKEEGVASTSLASLLSGFKFN